MRSLRWIGGGLAAVFLLLSLASLTAATDSPASATPISATMVASTPEATPTMDRLAPPPTVDPPTQADEGAQVYWLNCSACHGDMGQGLTDEWRAQYPPQDSNCWQSGCHGRGKDPPGMGFDLPTVVPALIGEESKIPRFGALSGVYQYMRIKMPYNAPGSLSDEEYLAITAFLARAHGIWDGTPLNADNVAQIRWQPLPDEDGAVSQEPDSKVEQAPQPAQISSASPSLALWIGLITVLILSGGIYLARRRGREN